MNYYVTDGSEESFYTAAYDALRDPDGVITCDGRVRLHGDDRLKRVIFNADKAERMKARLRACYEGAADDVERTLGSDEAGREQAAFEYIKLLTGGGTGPNARGGAKKARRT